MITIDVWINDRKIATAEGVNISDLNLLSDYAIEVSSLASPITGAGPYQHKFEITGHSREQTAWTLVAKIAAEAARRESTAAA